MEDSTHLVSSIVLWKDKKKSGLYFLAGNMLFVTLIYYNIFTVAFLFSFFLCSLGMLNIGFEYLKGDKLKKLDNSYDYEYVSKETITKAILLLYGLFYQIRQKFYSSVQKGDYKQVFYVIIGLILINFLAGILCDFCVCWVSFNIAFVGPFVISTKSDKILSLINKAEEQAGKVLDKAL